MEELLERLEILEEFEENRCNSLTQLCDSLKMAGIADTKATLIGMMISNLIRSEMNLVLELKKMDE